MNRGAQTQTFAARGKSQGGQALLLFVLSVPLLFGMVGLAFDIGFLEMMQRRAQTAADAGAIAGAIGLPYSEVTAGADAGAAANGFPSSSVTVHNPPTLGPHAGGSCSGSSPSANCNYVEVIVQQSVPTFFLRVINIASSTNVAARAVATNLSGDCIFALNPTASGALTIEPFALVDINAPACAMIIDSNSSSAFSAALDIVNITTSQTSIVGNYSCFIAICTFTPAPIIGATALSDPLAYLPVPTLGGCTGAGTSLSYSTGTHTVTPASHCYNVTITGAANVTFNPGAYTSITVNGAFAPTLTFNAGTYTIEGSGSLNLTGSGATVTGTGVTFYLGHSATGGLHLYAGDNVSVFNYMKLTAPTTGTYAGILFFQDRGNASNACIGGCGGSVSGIFNFLQVQGALYFSDAQLTMDGCCQYTTSNSYYTAYEIVVANKIAIAWDWFNDDYSSLPGGSPIKKTVLTE